MLYFGNHFSEESQLFSVNKIYKSNYLTSFQISIAVTLNKVKPEKLKNQRLLGLLIVLKGYASSYDIKVLYLEIQQYNLMKHETRSNVKTKLKSMFEEIRGFKFQITLVIDFKKELNDEETEHVSIFFNSNAELIINDLNIDETFESSYQTITSRIQKGFGGRVSKVN